jgi:hypothetical protein
MRSMSDAADIASGGILYAVKPPEETRSGFRPEQRLCQGEVPSRETERQIDELEATFCKRRCP